LRIAIHRNPSIYNIVTTPAIRSPNHGMSTQRSSGNMVANELPKLGSGNL
jgi:hypothetical protein